MKTIVNIGPVELYETDAKKYLDEKRYIITYSKIYKIGKHKDGTFYGIPVYCEKGLTQRGRFYALTIDNLPTTIDKTY